MHGGIGEIHAYMHGSPLSKAEVTCCSISQEGSPSKICDASSTIFGGFRNPYALPEDFFLIAECDENSGPVPLAVIPKGGAQGIDLNTLTLKLLSSDYQGFGSTSSVPILDTQSLSPDLVPNVHAVVNYFALSDVHSRGYVRPMCLAYLSSDKFKLVQKFLPIRNSLVEACRIIKFHNRCLFLQDIEFLLKDLIFTKEERQGTENLNLESNRTVSKLQEELIDVTIGDLKCIQERLQPLMEEESCEHLSYTRAFLKQLENSEIFNACHTLQEITWHFQRSYSDYQPRILKLPLRSNFKDGLRPTEFICDIGFLMGLYHLHFAHKFFNRKYENIFLTSKELINPVKCLRFGACIQESIYSNSNFVLYPYQECDKFLTPVPHSPLNSMFDSSLFMDSGFLDLVQQFYSGRSTNHFLANRFASHERYSSGLDTSSETSLESISPSTSSETDSGFHLRSHLPRNYNLPVENLPPRCYWHGSPVSGLLDIIDQMDESVPDLCFALALLQRCTHLPELFYGLLMGQCTIVTGPHESAPVVRALVRALSISCPRDGKLPLHVQSWREIATSLKDLNGMALIGMPSLTDNKMEELVPHSVQSQVSVWNIKMGSFSGHSYKGLLLNGLPKRLKSVPSKGPLLATLVGFLADLELKVQVWRSMSSKCNEGSVMSAKYFTSKGFTRNDLDILETLSTMLM